MTEYINFLGGPGAGKSTMAAKLFGWMKERRMNVEYVPEFAKDLTWRNCPSIDDQIYILGEQHHRLYTLMNQVDYVVTDSPLALQIYYINIGNEKFQKDFGYERFKGAFIDLVLAVEDMYKNRYLQVVRGDRIFVQAGRYQNEEESKNIDQELANLMDFYALPTEQVQTLDDVLIKLGFHP